MTPPSSKAWFPAAPELSRATAIRSSCSFQVPTLQLALEDEGLLFIELALMDLFHALSSGYRKLGKNHLLGTFSPEDNVGSEACLGYLLWEFELLLKVHSFCGRVLLFFTSAAAFLPPELCKWRKPEP